MWKDITLENLVRSQEAIISALQETFHKGNKPNRYRLYHGCQVIPLPYTFVMWLWTVRAYVRNHFGWKIGTVQTFDSIVLETDRILKNWTNQILTALSMLFWQKARKLYNWNILQALSLTLTEALTINRDPDWSFNNKSSLKSVFVWCTIPLYTGKYSLLPQRG